MTRSLLMLLPLLGACAPTISVRVLQPAAVTLPPEVKTLAIVDRSAAHGAGEQVLSVIEGAVTGESVMGDREGAKRAIDQFVTVVEEGPRFEVVRPKLNREQSESSIWDDELGWGKVRRICNDSGADAVVALEAFDSDSTVNISQATGADGVLTFNAQREAWVMAAWRVYYPKEKILLDEIRDRKYTSSWTGDGATKEEALGEIPDDFNSVVGLGTQAGDAYGRRISPTFLWVSRNYYKKGDDRLKKVGRHFEAQDYDGAAEVLRKIISKEEDDKILGRAQFDMALYYEVQGDLESALEWAKKAAVSLGNNKSRGYVSLLSQRIADQKLLEEQMKTAPSTPASAPARGTTTPPANTNTTTTPRPSRATGASTGK